MRRKLTLIICAVLSAIALSSCAPSLPARFDTFATNVEKRSDSYSLKTWERKNEKFKKLCDEYKQNYKSYSSAERRSIHNSMATYAKTAAKSGVIAIGDAVEEIAEQISSMIEDAKSLFESLGLGKKK